jgi:pimeloyl-ACP methyl ester carboxylesterase/DNA-binding CsgD family transcriptional regulator
MSQEIRFAHVASGARIAWAAQGRGTPLLRAAHWMTHVGHDAQSPVWQPWLSRLGREFRFVRYDERGCGMSGADDDTPLSLETAVEELAVVADDAKLDRFALLGISGGAPPAIAYAVRHPTRVSHLVLLGAYACGTLAGEPSAEQRAWVQATQRLVELGWGRAGAPVQQFFTSTLIPGGTAEQAHALNEQQRLCCGPARAAALLQARLMLDVRALLPQLRCPTLVLHVDQDAAVSLESGRNLAAGIAGARFVALPGRNHIPLGGEPAFEQFCDAVAGFVRSPLQDTSSGNGGDGGADFTARERSLLHLVAAGRDNLQIGAELGLADKTVRNALSRLYTRLGVEGRPQAVVRARDLGFGG